MNRKDMRPSLKTSISPPIGAASYLPENISYNRAPTTIKGLLTNQFEKSELAKNPLARLAVNKAFQVAEGVNNLENMFISSIIAYNKINPGNNSRVIRDALMKTANLPDSVLNGTSLSRKLLGEGAHAIASMGSQMGNTGIEIAKQIALSKLAYQEEQKRNQEEWSRLRPDPNAYRERRRGGKTYKRKSAKKGMTKKRK